MTAPFVSRLDRLGLADSTQRVVAERLAAGDPEVVVAVADEQSHGRGRLGRRWVAPPGSALLVSFGFRPAWLAPRHAWRLPAIVALAMLEAAEDVAGLPVGSLGVKWPNDLVAEDGRADAPLDPGGAACETPPSSPETPAGFLKLAGVLGEIAGDAERIETAVVGIGVNVAWDPGSFPPDLAAGMTSLGALTGGRFVDRDRLLDACLSRLEPRYAALRLGRFDTAAWAARQRTTGRFVEAAVGSTCVAGTGTGIDPESGALLVDTPAGIVAVEAGEVTRCVVATSPPGALPLRPATSPLGARRPPTTCNK